MSIGFKIARPFLHSLPPETVHALGIFALRTGLLAPVKTFSHPSLVVKALGKSFPNPIGLAAGFDKNAVATGALLQQGFGFVETGTVTPLPQPGNPKPRMFRLSEDEAVINRLGFNNQGLEKCVAQLQRRKKEAGIVGVNIGKNKDGDAVADYTRGVQRVYTHADYITINISSPNTPGLRTLQKRAALDELLKAIAAVHKACMTVHGTRVPLLLKVAPDLDAQEKEDIADKAAEHGMDGLIISNTTVGRPDSLKSAHMGEQGGLSGKPLFDLSTQTLRDFYRLTGGRMLLIGVGGISSAADAYAKIRAGAALVQLYTALVYQGFGVMRDIEKGLIALLERDGFSHITDAVGVDVK